MGQEQERHTTRLTNIRLSNIRFSSVHKCDFPIYKHAAKKTPRLADAVSPGGCVFVIVFTDKRDSYSAVVSDQFKQVEFSFKSRVNGERRAHADQKPLYALGE